MRTEVEISGYFKLPKQTTWRLELEIAVSNGQVSRAAIKNKQQVSVLRVSVVLS